MKKPKINWQVRLKNKAFWATIVPALCLLIETILAMCGCDVHLDYIGNVPTIDVLNAILTALAVMGIIVDPTTQGISDSERAMTYTKPN